MSERERNDAELVLAHLDGSQAALETLFERYRRPFYSYLNRMLQGDVMTADDLFQELWIRIMRKLPECRRIDNFAGWGFRIAHNLAIEHFRRSASRRKIGAPTGTGELPDTVATEPEQGRAMDDEVMKRRLEAALGRLSPAQLEVFELRRQGVDFKEIARIQKCPVNTALGRMHKAVLALKKELAGEAL